MTKTDVELSPARAAARAKMYQRIDKEVGKGRGRRLDEQEWEPLPRFPTGTLGGNYVMGGGIPAGRIFEFFGPESGGKTTLAVTCLAQIQRLGHDVAYIDAEQGGYDPEWARTLGLNPDPVFTDTPETGEEAFKLLEIYLEGGVKGVVIDSVSALVTAATMKGDVGDQHVGQLPRLMSQELNRIKSAIADAGASVIFINQIREKIGQTSPGASNETTSGGRALRHFASMRLDVRRIGMIKQGDDVIGNQVKLRMIKNRGSAQWRQAVVPLMFGRGFDPVREVLEAGIDSGLIEQAGAWYTVNGERCQGKAQVQEYLEANPSYVQAVIPRLVAYIETGELPPA